MIKPLTSFRFIAALIVFLYHVGIWRDYQTGYIGVSFFFILSGFILCINYRERLRTPNFIQIKKFYLARFAKIYPTHLLTFILAVPIYFYIPLKHETYLYLFQAITNIFLVHSYIPFGNFSFNGPSWSIADEFFFYAIFPIMIMLALKHLTTFRQKIISICLLWFVLLLLAVLLSFNNGIIFWLFYICPFIRVFDFFVGVVMGLIFLEVNDLRLKSTKAAFTYLEILSIGLVLLNIYFSTTIVQNLKYGLFFTLSLSLLIFVFAFQKGAISKFLSNQLFVYLGNISFSFYMIHNLILTYSYWSIFRINITPITIIGCFLVTVVISSFLYYFYEEPLRRKIINVQDKTNTKLAKVAIPGG